MCLLCLPDIYSVVIRPSGLLTENITLVQTFDEDILLFVNTYKCPRVHGSCEEGFPNPELDLLHGQLEMFWIQQEPLQHYCEASSVPVVSANVYHFLSKVIK